MHLLRIGIRKCYPPHPPFEGFLVGSLCLMGLLCPFCELLIELLLDLLAVRSLALICLCLHEGVAPLGSSRCYLRLEELLLPAADLDRIVIAYLRDLLELDVLDCRDAIEDAGANLLNGTFQLLCCRHGICHSDHHPLDVSCLHDSQSLRHEWLPPLG